MNNSGFDPIVYLVGTIIVGWLICHIVGITSTQLVMLFVIYGNGYVLYKTFNNPAIKAQEAADRRKEHANREDPKNV